MIKRFLVPEQQEISLRLPLSYVGKKIIILIYAEDEIIEEEITFNGANEVPLSDDLHLTAGLPNTPATNEG